MKNLLNMQIEINADIVNKETGEIYSSTKINFYARDIEINADLIKHFEKNYMFNGDRTKDNTLYISYLKLVEKN